MLKCVSLSLVAKIALAKKYLPEFDKAALRAEIKQNIITAIKKPPKIQAAVSADAAPITQVSNYDLGLLL